jgi:GH18 family chitinase
LHEASLPLQIVCYYTNWSQYRPKHGKFLPEDIEPDLCTHIIFAFGWLKKGKLSSFESNDETKDGKVGLYERIMALKKANPKLKVLLAIGKFSFQPFLTNRTLLSHFWFTDRQATVDFTMTQLN